MNSYLINTLDKFLAILEPVIGISSGYLIIMWVLFIITSPGGEKDRENLRKVFYGKTALSITIISVLLIIFVPSTEEAMILFNIK